MELLPNLPVLANLDGTAQATQSVQPTAQAGQNQNGFSNLLTQLYPAVARLNGENRAGTPSLTAPNLLANAILPVDESGKSMPVAQTLLPPSAGETSGQLEGQLDAQAENTLTLAAQNSSEIPFINPAPVVKTDEEIKIDALNRIQLLVKTGQADVKTLVPEQARDLNAKELNLPVTPASATTLNLPEPTLMRDNLLQEYLDQTRMEAIKRDGINLKQLDQSFAQDHIKDLKNSINATTVRAGGVEQLNTLYTSLDTARDSTEIRSPTVRIEQQVNNPQWGQELASRILWMSKNQLQHAKLQLNPAHLGPIEVKVSVINEQATVSFVANHALVRDAIESALPRLKEAFAESGFQSLDVDVSTSSGTGQEHTNDHVKRSVHTTVDHELPVEMEDSQEPMQTEYVNPSGMSNYRLDLFV